MKDIRGTLTEAVAEIMHHNRNRPAIIEKIMVEKNYIRLGIDIENEKVLNAISSYIFMQQTLTPIDETVMVISKLHEYMDIELAESDVSHIYDLEASTLAVGAFLDLPNISAINNPELKSWLNDRGVIDEQIIKYKLSDLSRANELSEEFQIACGATIHPALRKWITGNEVKNNIPSGVLTPVFNLDNEIVGCHNRLLSTVPKIKFCSSIPNMWLFTNLRRGMEIEPKEIYIVEGVFDGLAIDKLADSENKNDIAFIAPSTGYWEPEQFIMLMNMLLEFPNSKIIPMFDNDRVGMKTNLATYYAIYQKLGLDTELKRWPKYAKDPSEAICKHNLSFKDLETISWEDLKKEYKNHPYEKTKDYEEYLSNRHASYNNKNYEWNNK